MVCVVDQDEDGEEEWKAWSGLHGDVGELVVEGIYFLGQKVGQEVDHFAKLGEGVEEECLEALGEFDWVEEGKIPYLL